MSEEAEGSVPDAADASAETPSEAAPPPPPPAADPAAPEAPPQASATLVPVKADVGKRIVAAIIDFGIAFVMQLVPGVGQLLGAAYMILRDGLELDFMNHRSVGKQVMKLHIESVDGAPLDLMTSVKRNWMFGLGPLVPLLLIIPILGWIMIPFVIFASLALVITELVLSLTDTEGRRLGDKWAGTMVAED